MNLDEMIKKFRRTGLVHDGQLTDEARKFIEAAAALLIPERCRLRMVPSTTEPPDSEANNVDRAIIDCLEEAIASSSKLKFLPLQVKKDCCYNREWTWNLAIVGLINRATWAEVTVRDGRLRVISHRGKEAMLNVSDPSCFDDCVILIQKMVLEWFR